MVITTNRLIAGLFTVLLLAAAFFSLERVLFADASFILFRLINQGSFQIQEHRYGSFITQSFPLMGAHLHLPLLTIAVLYSISFNLFYLAVILLLLYRFKEQSMAVLMSFYYILFVSDTFFWMNNELHQGIAWMFLFFASVQFMGKKKVHWLLFFPVFLLLAFLTLYTHPLLLFPTSFLWLFFILKGDWPFTRRLTFILTIILLVIAVSKLLISTGATSYYDAEKLQNIRQVSFEKIGEAIHSPFLKAILVNTITNYWLAPVLFLTGLVAAWKKKAWWPISLTAIYLAVYFLALCLTFNEFIPFYTESELMPASLFMTILFVYYTLPFLAERTQLIVLAFIFLVRIAYIGYASPAWIERKNWIVHTLHTMQKQGTSKAIIYEDEAIRQTLKQSWGTPEESIMASALQGSKPQRTFVVREYNKLLTTMPPGKGYMITSFEIIPYTSLNKEYFSVDTTSTYRVLPVR